MSRVGADAWDRHKFRKCIYHSILGGDQIIAGGHGYDKTDTIKRPRADTRFTGILIIVIVVVSRTDG